MLTAVQTVFSHFDLQLLKEIETSATFKHVSAGEVILRSGEYIQNTMLVLSGQVKIYREDEDGNEFFLYFLSRGEACAITMLCASKMEPSQVMAKVTEDADLVLLPLQKMESWMSKYKSWYEFVVSTYRNRFEEILQVLDQVAFRSMDERLEFYLQRQAESNENRQILLSHQEIANELNTSREVISRLLKKMEQRGKLSLSRNLIELFDKR